MYMLHAFLSKLLLPLNAVQQKWARFSVCLVNKLLLVISTGVFCKKKKCKKRHNIITQNCGTRDKIPFKTILFYVINYFETDKFNFDRINYLKPRSLLVSYILSCLLKPIHQTHILHSLVLRVGVKRRI
jgi:hypothetical protein